MVWAIPRLENETREYIPTREAAHHLRRSIQTLHSWSAGERNAPLQSIRVKNRLYWPVADIKRLLGVEV